MSMDFYPDIDQGWESDAAINMANGNAYRMLALLGIGSGRIKAEDLQMAIWKFYADAEQAGRQIEVYVARRLADLQVLVYAAGDKDIVVV